MSIQKSTQLPVCIGAARKGDVRTQFAALCYRMKGEKVQVLLVTSRGSRRWIIPKGWPIDGLTPAQSAAREAFEEAGVTGRVHELCLGVFSYAKYVDRSTGLPCLAMVYPLRVKSLGTDYPERGERRRKWFSRKKAAQRIAEPELAHMILNFDPRRFGG